MYTVERESEFDLLRAELSDAREDAEWLVRDEGFEALASALAHDDRRIWDPDDLYFMLEEEERIVRLLNADDETLAGYPDIDPPGGLIDWYFLEHPDLGDAPLVVSREAIGDDYELVIARFVPGRVLYNDEVMQLATLFLVLAVGPIAVISAYFTSRSVFRRLDTIAITTSEIGFDRIDARIPLSKKNDEFDRLAGGVNDMLDRIAALTRNLEGVTVDVAHDLKTPISNIAGRLQLIERDAGNPPAIEEHARVANEHIEALLRTLDALLRLGQIEAGARREAFERFDLSELANELAESFEPLFEEDDKTFEARISPHAMVLGDRNLVAQLITNLLENAIEHARDGARVWLELSADKDGTQLIVGDDGPGIAANRATDIFDRFVRMDPGRTKAGNGLGLSLVKSIAGLHGGTAEVVATEPGLVVAITFPNSAPVG
ncbi:MAG: ATP-binding protein, partial [Pseudomonadota bacterium]